MPISSLLLRTILYAAIQTSAIPYLNRHPPGFRLYNDKIVMTTRMDDVLNGSALCTKYYAPWFESTIGPREERVDSNDEFLSQPYTKYPRTAEDGTQLDAPVEAVYAEVFGAVEYGFKEGLWGCYLACQDLRKTIEWILSARIARLKHVRLKVTFSLLCPLGMISRTIRRPSYREHDTEKELQDALDYLRTLDKRLSLDEFVHWKMLFYGESALEVTSCECSVPTLEERLEAVDLYRSRHKKAAKEKQEGTHSSLTGRRVAAKRKRVRRRSDMQTCQTEVEEDDADATRAKIHRPDCENPSLPTGECSTEPLHNTDRSETGDLVREHEDLPERTNTNTMTCYDYDYPELDTGPSEQHQEQATTGQIHEAANVLRAALDIMADFDEWCMSGVDSFGSGSTSPKPSS